MFGGIVSRPVLAAQETVDDAIGQADEPGGAVVVLGKHTGDADQRQRAVAPPCVAVAIDAGDTAAGQLGRLVPGVGEDAVAPLDLLAQPRVGQRTIPRWIPRAPPR